jgi:hypothetical protein
LWDFGMVLDIARPPRQTRGSFKLYSLDFCRILHAFSAAKMANGLPWGWLESPAGLGPDVENLIVRAADALKSADTPVATSAVAPQNKSRKSRTFDFLSLLRALASAKGANRVIRMGGSQPPAGEKIINAAKGPFSIDH